MFMTRGRETERGAVAILTAVLAVALIAVSALAVDLGNSWARKRAVQKQVDVAAMSAGYLLPVSNGGERQAVADEVARSFQESENGIFAQDVSLSGSQLLAQGYITFQHDDDSSCAVSDMCTQMTVRAPTSRVTFGLANVLGEDGADVTARAVVRVESQLPRKQDTIPFWLPTGCANGSAQIDTTQGGNGNGNTSASPTTTSSSTPTTGATTPTSAATSASGSVTISPVGSHTISGTSPQTVSQGATVTITGQRVMSVPNNTDRASIRFVSPGNTFFVDFAVNESNPSGTVVVPSYTVTSAVTGTPGTWRVYALIRDKGNNKPDEYSSNYLTFNVSGSPATSSAAASSSTAASTSAGASGSTTASATSIPVGCVGQDRGNFGQLDSPRKDGPNLQQAFAYNIAGGIDHYLDYYRNLPAGTLVCSLPERQRPAVVVSECKARRQHQ